MKRRVRYNVRLMSEDIAASGLLPVDVARNCEIAASTVTRFLGGERQTARTAAKIAESLGQSLERYLIRKAQVQVQEVA